MATTFQRPVNNFKSTLSAQHTNGSGTLALQTGDGALLGALGTSQVYRITAVMNPGASETIVGIFEATGLSTDTLTGVTAVEGIADSTIASGTPVQVRATAKTFNDIQTAINALENAVITESSITGTTTISSALSSMGKYYVCSGTSANYTVTLPTIDSTYDGMTIGFRMDPALTKLVTITGTGTQTIDGTLARVMWTGETCLLEARGSKWYKLAGRTIPIASRLNRSASNTGTLTNSSWNNVDMDTVADGQAYTLSGGAFVAPRAAYYSVSIYVYMHNATAGYIGVIKNSQASPDYLGTPAAIGSETAGTSIWAGQLAAGDALHLAAYPLTGSSVVVYGSASPATLSAVEVPPW